MDKSLGNCWVCSKLQSPSQCSADEGVCSHSAELTKEEVKVVPVTQSAYMQRNKLKYLLEKVDSLLGLNETQRSKKWNVQSRSLWKFLYVCLFQYRHCSYPF